MMALGINAGTKALLSAALLEERTGEPFTLEELCLEAWKRFPKKFGLRGQEHKHPDTRKLSVAVFGKRGLVKRGYLKEMLYEEDTRYLLTISGRNIAQEMAMELKMPFGRPPPSPLPSANGLNDRLNDFLNRIVEGKAYDKSYSESDQVITFSESLEFWGIEQGTQGQLVQVYLDEFVEDLKMVDGVMKGTNGELVLRSGRSIEWHDIKTIRALHDSLLKHYHGLLGLLTTRKKYDRQ